MRYVLTIVLLLLIIGGITWIIQFHANWREPSPPGPIPNPKLQEILQYSRPPGQVGNLRAVWELDKDNNDTGYIFEAERNAEGHYCFPFRNMLGAPAEMELERADCDCTQADACLVPYEEWQKITAAFQEKPWASPPFAKEPDWHRFSKDEVHGFKVPADGYGVLRISWNGRKEPGQPLNLNLRFWAQPIGARGDRQLTPIQVPVRVVRPFMFEPLKQSVGALGAAQSGTATFQVWSASRDQLDISFGAGDKKDPLFEVDARPLTEPECKELQQELRNKAKGPVFRVRCGYLVTATLHEQKDDQQMDQGPFERRIDVILDQLKVTELPTPAITGDVKGVVAVGGSADQGKVQFRVFSAADPKTVVVPIYAEPQIGLEFDHREPEWLQAELKRNDKESSVGRAQWDLKVTVPAGTYGPLPEQSCVVLRIAGTSRKVRIPVAGTATR